VEAEWRTLSVTELQARSWLLVEDGNHGEYRPLPHEFGSGATAFIRAADMENGRVLFESADRISDAALAKIRKGVGKGGDILFSHKGTVGKLALVPFDAPPFVCSPQTTFWRVLAPTMLDLQFVYAFMRSDGFTEQWQARKGETDMADYVSLTAQRQFRVPVPPIEDQQAIGRIVGALDDKIDLNRQMNRTLEAMAQARFRSWFVDFDPVAAKAAGRQPVGMSSNTATVFPDHFDASPLGSVPVGWRVTPFSELVNIVGGGTPKTDVQDYWNGGIPWFSVVDTPAPGDVFVLWTEKTITQKGLDESAARLLDEGTTIITARGTVGNLALVGRPMAMNQSCYGLVGKRGYGPFFVYFATRELVEELRLRTHGSVFDTITRTTFDGVSTVLPPAEIASRFDLAVAPMLGRIRTNLKESRVLGTIRDTLLPKLLSGELRVREVEKLVEQPGV
jgi:type I restriction enzyme S subunit